MNEQQTKVLGSDVLNAGDKVELSVTKDKKEKAVFAAKILDFDKSARCNPTVRFARTKGELPELYEGELWTGKVSEIIMTKKIIPLKGRNRVGVFVIIEDLKREEETRVFFSKKEGLVRETKSGTRILRHDAIPATKEIHVMQYGEKLFNIGHICVCGQVVMRTDEGVYIPSMTSLAEKLMPLALKMLPRKKMELTEYMHKKLGQPYNSWETMEELYVNLPTPVSKAA
jgi:hypothetical protein